MRTMYDAAYPPPVPPATDAVGFYILPRDGDPAHVWFPTPQQDRAFRLPITVNSFGGNGAQVATDCKAWAQLNGMPPGTCFALDLETLVDAAFVGSFNATLWPWLCLKYGSRSSIFRDPPTSGGAWVATLDGTPRMYPGADATQWIDTGDVDLSLIGDQVRLWQPGAPPPPPPPKKGQPVKFFHVLNGNVFITDGSAFTWVPTQAALDAKKYSMTAAGAPPIFTGTVTDWRDMGVPTDSKSAAVAGAPWPPVAST